MRALAGLAALIQGRRKQRNICWLFASLIIIGLSTAPAEALSAGLVNERETINVVFAKDVIVPDEANNPNRFLVVQNSIVLFRPKIINRAGFEKWPIWYANYTDWKLPPSLDFWIYGVANSAMGRKDCLPMKPCQLGWRPSEIECCKFEFSSTYYGAKEGSAWRDYGDVPDFNPMLCYMAVYKRPLQIDQSSLGNLSRSRCRIGASLGSINTINGGGGSFGGEYQGHDYCPDAYHAGDELIESPFGLFLGRYCGAPFLTILCIFAGWGACAMWFVWTGIMDKNRRLRWRLWLGLGIFGLAFWGDLVLTQAYFR